MTRSFGHLGQSCFSQGPLWSSAIEVAVCSAGDKLMALQMLASLVLQLSCKHPGHTFCEAESCSVG